LRKDPALSLTGNQNVLVQTGNQLIQTGNQLISTNVNQEVMNLYAQVDKSRIAKNRASGGSRFAFYFEF
jgi:hypothetical protein